MDHDVLRKLLDGVRDGTASVEEAVEKLRTLPFEDLGFAKVDHHRAVRTGVPEVIFCAGKSAEQIVAIARSMVERESLVLGTHADETQAAALQQAFQGRPFDYKPASRTVVVGEPKLMDGATRVVVVAAGTSDIPVAEEAAVTARCLGCPTDTLYDVGVSGIHRLLASREKLDSAGALVVVAGMEGALPSVVGGLVSVPVVAVPTSIGYGASFGGLAALLAMLNSCAAGVTVVNIDNGFGGGYAAALMCRPRLGRGD